MTYPTIHDLILLGIVVPFMAGVASVVFCVAMAIASLPFLLPFYLMGWLTL